MRKNNKRSRAAKKAHATRNARKMFRETYPDTCDIVEDIMTGLKTEVVADLNDVTVSTVAAVKANLVRENVFAHMAHSCNF